MNLKTVISILLTFVFSIAAQAQDVPPPPKGPGVPGLPIPGLGIGVIFALLFGIYKTLPYFKNKGYN